MVRLLRAGRAFRRIPRHGPPHLRSQRDFGRVHRSHPGDCGRRAARLLDAAHGSERGDALRAHTYELDEKAPSAMREWAQKLEAKAKYVVSGSRTDFPWK